jgi:ubiquinone/menaquinone biosynthesis C-methylase UbiE
MQASQNIFLPGGFKQFRILRSKFTLRDKSVLVIGSASEMIAQKIADAGASSVKMIIDDFDSMMNAKLNIPDNSPVDLKMMEYDATDFSSSDFDLVYAQGSISTSNRNKIIKEIKRILKSEGTLCVGEITCLTNTYPTFIKDIFDSSDILPLNHDECSKYYEGKNFVVRYEQDLSSSLKNFYETAEHELKENIDKLSGQEKSYYKKILNKISHESNAYLKLGADKFIGYKMLILKLSGSAS